jgi:hypothetical protein
MKDLVLGDKKTYLTLSTRQLDDLGDFSENDDIEITIKGRVVKMDMPPAPEVTPDAQEPDYNENPELLKPDTKVTLELLEGEVLNKKEKRKRAENLDMTKEDLDQVNRKRSEGKYSRES